MSETRRDIFRRSIFSAIGGVIAGALGGCAIGRETKPFAGGPTGKGGGPQRPFVSPLAGSVVAVYNQTNTRWYFFTFDGEDPHTCTVSHAPDNTYFPVIGKPGTAATIPTPTNVVDTASWASALSLTKVVNSDTPVKITYKTASNGSGRIDVTKIVDDSKGTIDPPSLNSLLLALVDLGQIPGSWNEIGVNHN